MPKCLYCKALVPDLANHYGGHKCEPCPDVAYAFGPDKLHSSSRAAALPPGAYARSEFAHVCMEMGCDEPVYRANRCWEHHRSIRQRWQKNERAREREQGSIAA